MKLRPYKAEDSQIICSWVKDEKTLFQWSADRIGKFPLIIMNPFIKNAA